MMKLMWKRISEFKWGAAGERRPFIKTSTGKISLKIHQWRSLRERENKKTPLLSKTTSLCQILCQKAALSVNVLSCLNEAAGNIYVKVTSVRMTKSCHFNRQMKPAVLCKTHLKRALICVFLKSGNPSWHPESNAFYITIWPFSACCI